MKKIVVFTDRKCQCKEIFQTPVQHIEKFWYCGLCKRKIGEDNEKL
jgi:hypothetical protein